MPQYFYLYSNEGDETIQNFGGSWDQKNKRWRLPFEMSGKVYEYLKSLQEVDVDDADTLPPKKKPRRKKVHRENSFMDDYSSEEEIH